MLNDTHQDKFAFFVSENQDVALVAFVGEIGGESGPALDRCIEQITQLTANSIVFCFRNVTAIERPSLRPLVLFQKAVRDMRRGLRLSSLKPELKRLLLEAGAVRQDELADNLAAAIQSFSLMRRRTG